MHEILKFGNNFTAFVDSNIDQNDPVKVDFQIKLSRIEPIKFIERDLILVIF